jgi:uncharacterized protein (TIGR03067 family)
MLARTVFVLAVCIVAVGFARADNAAEQDLKDMQGDWQAVALEAQGQKAPAEEVKKFRIRIKGNAITFFPDGENRTHTFKLNPSKSPKEIDLVPGDGDLKGKTVGGLYALEKGQLKLCIPNFSQGEPKRPRALRTQAGDGLGLIVFERARPK